MFRILPGFADMTVEKCRQVLLIVDDDVEILR